MSNAYVRGMLCILVAMCAACGGQSGNAGAGDAIEPGGDGGLTNVSRNLDAVLENGQLQGACERYEADPESRHKRLMCGKYLFFYGTFGTLGAPQAFVDYLLKWFPDIVGEGFRTAAWCRIPIRSRATRSA